MAILRMVFTGIYLISFLFLSFERRAKAGLARAPDVYRE
jgi:hypothetical protein